MDEASSLVTEATLRLWEPEGGKALDYLRGRCLTDETIRAARLGFIASVMIPTRNRDRYFRVSGLTIPWFDGNRLALVKVRQPDGRKPKYAEAFRDRPDLYPGPEAIRQGCPLISTEGEFDALLLGQEVRDLAAVVTLGSSSIALDRLDPASRARLRTAPVWFVAHDADESGDRSAANWPTRARRVRPPVPFKDWTEAAQGGINLRLWWAPRLGTETLWRELATLRWGRAYDNTFEDGHDLYATAERQAIQQEDGS
jgi:hypothetical protein